VDAGALTYAVLVTSAARTINNPKPTNKQKRFIV
jgi:hypothetical protein